MNGKRSWSPFLAYSTNVHRGEGLRDIYRHLEASTIPIQRRVFGAEGSGLELRIGKRTARELEATEAFEAFASYLRDKGLVLFSVNAFPLLDFQAARVKERVYIPSWADPERPRWTIAIARILARLLPAGVRGTVSTLGGGFRPAGRDAATLCRMAEGYVAAVHALAGIEDELERRVVLAVEPEPCTVLETWKDVVAFFEGYVVPAGRRRWRRSGLSEGEIEGRLRRHFTVNFDACHFSVIFEDLLDSLHGLLGAGLEVSKIHVTSALALRRPGERPEAYARFRRLAEPRYLHQFAGRGPSGETVWRGIDLGELPRRLPRRRGGMEVAELRTHFHAPLYRRGWESLETTRDETRRLVLEVAGKRLSDQLVVETYTWPLLRAEDEIAEGIVRELRWLLGVIEEVGTEKAATARDRAFHGAHRGRAPRPSRGATIGGRKGSSRTHP